METFRIMTFNIRGAYFGESLDGENIWQNRAEFNVTTIRRNSPDLIGFQEYQHGNRDVYDDYLDGYNYELGPVTVDNSEFGMFNPIYWRADRFQKVVSGGFYISPSPDTYSTGWDSALVRAANWVRLRSMQTGFELIFLNPHLDHIGEAARVAGAKLIVDRLAAIGKPDLPLIVTADFNSRAWSPEPEPPYPEGIAAEDVVPANTVYKVFMEAGYKDTFREAGMSESIDTNTFHGFKGRAFPAYALRIDWILTRDGARRFSTRFYDIVQSEELPIYPSDHYPVVAEVTLR